MAGTFPATALVCRLFFCASALLSSAVFARLASEEELGLAEDGLAEDGLLEAGGLSFLGTTFFGAALAPAPPPRA